jgi:hypothetical protein
MNRSLLSRRFCAAYVKGLLLAFLAATTMLSACGGGSSGGSENSVTLSGNWQFTVAPPADGSFLGGLQGGFLLLTNRSVTGSAVYAVSLPQLPYPCNSGSAPITGTISGQNVTLTAVAGTQTFSLTGMLSSDGSTMVGTYASTAGTAADGTACGTAQSGLQWSAISVPPLTGTVAGSFHSTGGASGLSNQDFAVSGSLTEGENTGASNATVTGTLSFIATGGVSDYPCFNIASVNGQISGNSVTLQIGGTDGSILGQIGEPAGSNGVTGVNPVTFDSAQGGYILHGVGPSYLVATNTCPGSLGSIVTAGDDGNICLAVSSTLGTENACQQPITLTPDALTFPAQTLGTTSTQTITLANTLGVTLNGLALTLANIPATAANFAETDACGLEGAPSQGGPFYLGSGQSCAITITFIPECATQCASPLVATLTVTSPMSPDNDTAFAVPITGTVTSDGAVSTRAIDFGAEDVSKASLAQWLSFTNRGGHPKQTLPSPSNRTFQDVEHHAEIY